MNPRQLLAYCLQKPSAYLDCPFDPMTPVVKAGVPQQSKGRTFAQMPVLRREPEITPRCTPSRQHSITAAIPGRSFPAGIVRPCKNRISIRFVLTEAYRTTSFCV